MCYEMLTPALGNRMSAISKGLLKYKIITEIIRHVTDSDRNGFDSEYAIAIDFLLGSSDFELFC